MSPSVTANSKAVPLEDLEFKNSVKHSCILKTFANEGDIPVFHRFIVKLK